MTSNKKPTNFQKELIISASNNVSKCKIKKLNYLKKNSEIKIKKKNIKLLENWNINYKTGNLSHLSGKFFQIKGVKYKDTETKNFFLDPMIFQNEIGILGIICKKKGGVLKFLLQAKFEPGNLNKFQLSPTVQATRSNIEQVHGGKSQAFIEYFKRFRKEDVILNILQSEQGDKFYKKKNRNMLIFTNRKVILGKKNNFFFWLSLSEIKELMQYGNIINMDTRSVISCINFGNSNIKKNVFFSSILNNKRSLNSINYILRKLKKERSIKYPKISIVSLNKVLNSSRRRKNQLIESNCLVQGLSIKSNSREVSSWDQPMIQTYRKETYVLFIKKIKNKFHALLNLSNEPAIFNKCEFGPSIKFINGNESTEEFFLKKILKEKSNKKIHQSFQSEEGGRFYKVSNCYLIILLGENEVRLNNFQKKIWVGLNQFQSLISKPSLINIQLRTLYSLIKLH